MTATVENVIRTAVRELAAYHVPDPGDAIKLDAMENPYAWPAALPDGLAEKWSAGLAGVAVNRYPDPAAKALRKGLRVWMGIDDLNNADELDIILGNGSDELIQLLAMAVRSPDGMSRPVILAPEPGFVMYRMIARFVDADYVGIALTRDFELDLDAMLTAIKRHQPALVFLAYPNNPTGNLWAVDDMEAIVQAAPGLVVIDEAYTAFAADSRVEWLARYPQLLVMRTLSKVGLAGLRLGMLAGQKRWLNELDKIRLPYNINSLTQYSANFALQNMHPLQLQAQELMDERAKLFATLLDMGGVEVWSSQANFLLFRVANAVDVHARLAGKGVLIKKLHGAHDQLEQCLRVTIGTASENSQFVEALIQVLQSN